MSNSHLFLKSGFPRAPLQNGVGRYVGQLQRIVLKFCKNHGGSKGMRNFLENQLIDFSKENPGVVVYVKPRRHRAPVVIGEYLNGERHWMSMQNRTEDEITKWVNLMVTQNCNSSETRLRKLQHTEVPSIQGPWSPYTYQNPELNVTEFPDPKLSQPIDLTRTATEILLEMYEKQKQEKEQQEKLDAQSVDHA